MKRQALDLARCEALCRRGAAGDASATRELVTLLWPVWIALIGANRAIKGLPQAEDHVHDVVARLVENLGRADGRGLQLYLLWSERNAGKTFEDWLRIVTRNAVRDHLREHLGRPKGANEPSPKRLLNEFVHSPLVEELGIRPPMTDAQTARDLLKFAADRLEARQHEILCLWLQGAGFEDIAKQLGREAEAVRRELRASIAVLRRKFAGPDA